jgi:hypothetical protein
MQYIAGACMRTDTEVREVETPYIYTTNRRALAGHVPLCPTTISTSSPSTSRMAAFSESLNHFLLTFVQIFATVLTLGFTSPSSNLRIAVLPSAHPYHLCLLHHSNHQ